LEGVWLLSKTNDFKLESAVHWSWEKLVQSDEQLLCVACRKPVEVSKNDYEIFEQMHWLCFHLLFEHDGDPDEACGDPSCPWGRIDVLEQKLRSLGIDPAQVQADADVTFTEDAPQTSPSDWADAVTHRGLPLPTKSAKRTAG
jgi:hypothetical protein